MKDTDVVLMLSEALEEAKPLATRLPRKTVLHRPYILLCLARRAARRQKFGLCQAFVNRAIPGFSRWGLPVTGKLLKVFNHFERQLQAA